MFGMEMHRAFIFFKGRLKHMFTYMLSVWVEMSIRMSYFVIIRHSTNTRGSYNGFTQS